MEFVNVDDQPNFLNLVFYHSRSLSPSWVREDLHWSKNRQCLKKVGKHWDKPLQ